MSAAAEHWGIMNAILARYLALRTNETDPGQQSKCLKAANAQKQELLTMEQSQIFGKKHEQTGRDNYYETLGDLDKLDVGQIENLLDQYEGHLAKAMARGFTAQTKSFASCAKESWKGKVGLLQR